MPFEFGDVVLLPFPFTDQAASKKRPAVIVSSRVYNAAKPDVIVMAIASSGTSRWSWEKSSSRIGNRLVC